MQALARKEARRASSGSNDIGDAGAAGDAGGPDGFGAGDSAPAAKISMDDRRGASALAIGRTARDSAGAQAIAAAAARAFDEGRTLPQVLTLLPSSLPHEDSLHLVRLLRLEVAAAARWRDAGPGSWAAVAAAAEDALPLLSAESPGTVLTRASAALLSIARQAGEKPPGDGGTASEALGVRLFSEAAARLFTADRAAAGELAGEVPVDQLIQTVFAGGDVTVLRELRAAPHRRLAAEMGYLVGVLSGQRPAWWPEVLAQVKRQGGEEFGPLPGLLAGLGEGVPDAAIRDALLLFARALRATVRQGALLALIKRYRDDDDPRVRRALLAVPRDPNEGVRAEVAAALIASEHRDAAPLASEHRDAAPVAGEHRDAAPLAGEPGPGNPFGLHGEDARPRPTSRQDAQALLVRLSDDPCPAVRAAAAWSLLACDEVPASVQELCATDLAEGSLALRYGAALAAACLGSSEPAIGPLLCQGINELSDRDGPEWEGLSRWRSAGWPLALWASDEGNGLLLYQRAADEDPGPGPGDQGERWLTALGMAMQSGFPGLRPVPPALRDRLQMRAMKFLGADGERTRLAAATVLGRCAPGDRRVLDLLLDHSGGNLSSLPLLQVLALLSQELGATSPLSAPAFVPGLLSCARAGGAGDEEADECARLALISLGELSPPTDREVQPALLALLDGPMRDGAYDALCRLVARGAG